VLDGLCGHGETVRAEMVAKEIEATLDPPDEGLVSGCFSSRSLPSTSLTVFTA